MIVLGKVANRRHIFNEHPKGYPVPGKTTIYTSEAIDLDNVPLNGGILVRVVVLSLDPYLRYLMNNDGPQGGLNFTIGEPLFSFGIARVLKSEDAKYEAGNHVLYSMQTPQEEYSVIAASKLPSFRLIEKSDKLPWAVYVGAAGMPGITAFGGWKEYAQAKKGETVFVSTGAGAVGSLVCQIAKLEGLKVIASTGSDDKLKLLKDIGVDVAFNYKTVDMRQVLQKEGPIDIYWDNVGGDTLDAALENMADFGRVLVCGQISAYNGVETPVKNFTIVLHKQLTIHGLQFASYENKYKQEFKKQFLSKLASGEIQYAEDKRIGLDTAAKAMLDLFSGENIGKSVIVVDESDQ